MPDTLVLIRHLAYEKDITLHQRKEIEKCVLKLLKNKNPFWFKITKIINGCDQ